MRIGIVGTGSWGTALGNVLADNHHDVIMWGRSDKEVEDISVNHQNSLYFQDTKLNENLKATSNFDDLKGLDVYLLAVPTAAVEEVSIRLNSVIEQAAIIINVAKGFHPVTHDLLSVVIEKSIPQDKRLGVVSLIGPSHAEEVVLGKLTTVNAVCADEVIAYDIQKLFSNDYFRVYRNTDVIGCQIGVAIKNIIAVISGAAAGLDLGDNARAALITRGLAEMTRYGLHFGAKAETFLGLCGVGDLIVTCSSEHSRNFQAGFEIGQKNSAVEYMKHITKTVEGIHATKVVYDVMIQEGLDMPLTNEAYQVLYQGKKPSDAILDLMNRSLKDEGATPSV